MGINLISPTSFTTSVLIGDTSQAAGGSNDSTPSLTKVGGVPVNAALEIQSTSGAFLLPRMTSAQINALTTVVDGMGAYDTTLNSVRFRQNGAWGQGFSASIVSLTTAQFAGMYANPVQLIAAPGAGKMILILSSYLELVFVSTQYANGGAIQLQYGNTNHAGGQNAAGNIAAATINGLVATSILGMPSGIFLNAVPTAPALNQGIFISNDTAAFDTGDSTFIINVLYTIIQP